MTCVYILEINILYIGVHVCIIHVRIHLNNCENVSWITGSKSSHYHQNLSTGVTGNMSARMLEKTPNSPAQKGSGTGRERGRRND